MSRVQEEKVHEQAQLLPTKDTLTALKSDVTLESACLELCDNSIDAWERTSNRTDPGIISIDSTIQDDRTELTIRDNTGGVPREQASMLFGLGRTAKTQTDGTIGTFGVGAKKSLVNLGVPFRIKSRAAGEASGWTYKITEEWFDREQDWTVPIHESDELPPGTTEIKIYDLNYRWNGEISEHLRTQLGKAYNMFLSDDMQDARGTDYDLTITVDGESVVAEGSPSWSYTPFDRLHPRRYENIQISDPEMENQITLHITVGLLTKKDATKAGTDIYCQERKVRSALRNNVGGFGNSTDQIGNFNSRHERLKIIVELETTGDGRRLPWNTQKTSIDEYNPIMQGSSSTRGVYNWLRRCVQEYFDADADKVPRAFVEPYGDGHDQAANEGELFHHDFSDRQRVSSTCRPNGELDQISALQRRVRAHEVFNIWSTDNISGWKVPAYRIQYATEAEDSTNDPLKTESTLPDKALEQPHSVRGSINKLSRIHLKNGFRCDDYLEDWQKPSYNSFFEQHSTDAVPTVTTIPNELPCEVEEITTDDSSVKLSSAVSPEIYSSQTIPDNKSDEENAEMFIVFTDDENKERGAKVFNMSRREICRHFDLKPNAGDDVVWEHIRHQLSETFSGNQ